LSASLRANILSEGTRERGPTGWWQLS
jgi:hypothetical protein